MLSLKGLVGRKSYEPVGHRTHVRTSIPSSTSPMRCIVYPPPTDNTQRLFPSEYFQARLVRQDRDSNSPQLLLAHRRYSVRLIVSIE